MATTNIILMRPGQEVVRAGGEVELRIPQGAHTRELNFRVPTGALQVTVATHGQNDVIGGDTHAFVLADGTITMHVEPALGSPEQQRTLYVKGTGTIVVWW